MRGSPEPLLVGWEADGGRGRGRAATPIAIRSEPLRHRFERRNGTGGRPRSIGSLKRPGRSWLTCGTVALF